MTAIVDVLKGIDAASRDRVGPSTSTVLSSGVQTVVGEPFSLAQSAKVSMDVYALARMIASEEGSGNAPTLLCLGEAARNEAKRRGTSVFSLLTNSTVPALRGRFGEQRTRWASTRLDPNGRHVAAATAALSGTGLARGARDFFDPATQATGEQLGKPLRLSVTQYITDNASNGLAWVGPIEGINPGRLMLFVNAPKPIDTSAAFAALKGHGSTVLVALLIGAALFA
jgi:hypothetical protein